MPDDKLNSANLILKTGGIFSGLVPAWNTEPWDGEVVFTTGMTGYVESLTDPSFAGQILVFSFPLVGNYGVSGEESWESSKIHAKGVILSSIASNTSHYESKSSFPEWLKSQNVPYLTGVDTRALTKALREHGTVLGCVTSTLNPLFPETDMELIKKSVSLLNPKIYGSGNKKIILVDCGMKENILRCLLKFPLQIKRVPHNYDYSGEDFDGVVLSNGPGDPLSWKEATTVLQKAMQKKKPIFGICLGAQLMALANGAKTFKLPFGHRGQNQPCLECETGKAFLTSQNHGYAIDPESLKDGWLVSFRNLNDHSVEGIKHTHLPFSAVQFHPEAAPGPVDTFYLFNQFFEQL